MAVTTSAADSQVTYHEPTLPQLLTLIAFFYLLQVARAVCDAVFGAGLLGESKLKLDSGFRSAVLTSIL